jgi:large subunit ribosomal protein L4
MSPARKDSTPEEPQDVAQEAVEDAVPGARDDEPDTGAEVEQIADEAPAEDEAGAEDAAEAAEPEQEPAKPARRRTAAKAAADEAEDGEAKQAPAKAPARSRTSRPAATKPKRKAPVASYGLVDADLPGDVFDAQVNVPLIHQVVVAQQAAARQGTHSTKTRGDVRGGGKKPYRQKGTGRARQGSTRAPQFTGGGIVHGPVPRSYAQKTPKKMKAAALRGALSDRARHGLVQVVEGFVDGTEPKTRDALAVLNLATGSESGRNVLVVVESTDQVTWKSLRNAVGVHLIDPGQLNTYDVLVSDRVVFTSGALASFLARAGRTDREDARL